MQFLYVRMRTAPDDFRLVSIELKTASYLYESELRQLSSVIGVSVESCGVSSVDQHDGHAGVVVSVKPHHVMIAANACTCVEC